jgi:hypothetical protein
MVLGVMVYVSPATACVVAHLPPVPVCSKALLAE